MPSTKFMLRSPKHSSNNSQRIIAHLDMDAFFAAVEERDRPRLKGKPIVVGADPQDGRGRGIVATANYAARKYGIHSAMPISWAWRASEEAKKRGEPEVVFIQGSHGKYGAVSEKIYEIVKSKLGEVGSPKTKKRQYLGDPTSANGKSEVRHRGALRSDLENLHDPGVVQRASIDEVYFDLSRMGSYKAALRRAQGIKKAVWQKERLTCSIGIGPNKLIAKIASDMQKPDGLTVVGHDDEATCRELVERFLEPLPIRKIPGIGPKAEILLNKKGVRIVKDIKRYSQKEMADMMGAWGLSLYKKVRGISDSPIVDEHETKSIGEQETFMSDTLDANILLPALSKIARSVVYSVGKDGFKTFRTVVLTVRFEDFKTVTRSKTFKKPLGSSKELESVAINSFLLFLDKRENPHHKKIRLIGVRVEKFD